jgi:hypothetical protein
MIKKNTQGYHHFLLFLDDQVGVTRGADESSATCSALETACSVGWWLMAGADLF